MKILISDSDVNSLMSRFNSLLLRDDAGELLLFRDHQQMYSKALSIMLYKFPRGFFETPLVLHMLCGFNMKECLNYSTLFHNKFKVKELLYLNWKELGDDDYEDIKRLFAAMHHYFTDTTLDEVVLRGVFADFKSKF